MKTYLLILASTIAFTSCEKHTIDDESQTPQNQFVVIGHAYGNPVSFKLSLYTKLVPILGELEAILNPDEYIFTGDVVAKATEENWTNTLRELDSLGIDNYWIAPGNHDLSSSYFEENIQPQKFFTERINDNLFLVLNTNFEGWTVSSEQLSMLHKELNNLEKIKNIFVFSHHVWWQNEQGAVYNMTDIITNSQYLAEGPSSFWDDAFALFQKTELPTYFFSGDVGAWNFIPGYDYYNFDNFHFYASGLGGGTEDNVIIIRTFEDGEVEIGKLDF